MRYMLSFFCFALYRLVPAQETAQVLFWTAQDWPCEVIAIEVYNSDSLLIASGKLKEKFIENRIPECADEKVLLIENLPPDSYFFIADCYKEECPVCHGEGSYWQPIVQDKSTKQVGIKTKANIEGTYKTCYVCKGDGASYSTIWKDSLSVEGKQCRSILLK